MYDESEQSRKPLGPQERDGAAREVGQEGIRSPDAGVGQARRQAQGQRQEDKESEVNCEYL
jgi:hypothetical protein